MYQVMVVDDEPMAASLIVNIIKQKYNKFEIMGTAYNGEEALELIQEKGEPDILITDIQMPVMNGLKLVEETKKQYPNVISVIVSGYQEFEYAKQAIAFGVCDYILKPIVPSEFSKLITRIEEKLKQKYYKERNTLIHKMVNEIPVDEKTLRRYFQSECYYGAIVRLNGLPSRYGERGKKEVFSDINEMMIAYGRDTQETLYLCPGELVNDEDYEQMIRRRIGKEQPEAAYVTSVIRRNDARALPEAGFFYYPWKKSDIAPGGNRIAGSSWKTGKGLRISGRAGISGWQTEVRPASEGSRITDQQVGEGGTSSTVDRRTCAADRLSASAL